MVVVDASAILALLLDRPRSALLRERLYADFSWQAPHHVDLEVAEGLRGWERRGDLDPRGAEHGLDLIADLPLTRWPHLPFLPRLWRLRNNLTAYDAMYIALAEALDVPLITCDRRIAAAPGHRAKVEVFA